MDGARARASGGCEWLKCCEIAFCRTLSLWLFEICSSDRTRFCHISDDIFASIFIPVTRSQLGFKSVRCVHLATYLTSLSLYLTRLTTHVDTSVTARVVCTRAAFCLLSGWRDPGSWRSEQDIGCGSKRLWQWCQTAAGRPRFSFFLGRPGPGGGGGGNALGSTWKKLWILNPASLAI